MGKKVFMPCTYEVIVDPDIRLVDGKFPLGVVLIFPEQTKERQDRFWPAVLLGFKNMGDEEEQLEYVDCLADVTVPGTLKYLAGRLQELKPYSSLSDVVQGLESQGFIDINTTEHKP